MKKHLHRGMTGLLLLCFLFACQKPVSAKADEISDWLLGAEAEKTEGDYAYQVRPEANTAVITGYHGGSTAVVPETLGGCRVTGINAEAFYELTRGSSVTIPASVEYIGTSKVKDESFASLVLYIESGSSAEYYAELLNIPYQYTQSQLPSGGQTSGASTGDDSIISTDAGGLQLPSGYNGDGFYGNIYICDECGFEHVNATYGGDIANLSIPLAYDYSIYHYYESPHPNGTTYTIQSKFGFPKSDEAVYKLNASYPVIGVYSINAPKATRIDLPNSIAHIAEATFSRCEKLAYFKVPPLVSEIKESTFQNCCSLKEIDLNRVTKIGKNAFWKCLELHTLNLPSSLTSIGDAAFMGCTSLKSVTIPASVTEIGNYAFGYDTSDSGMFGTETYTISNQRTAITDFVIYGYSGTAAEEYCNRNDFIQFIPLDKEIETDQWTAVVEDINDRYAAGEKVIDVRLESLSTNVPSKVFETIKKKKDLVVDFYLSIPLSWSVSGNTVSDAKDTEMKAVLTEAPEILGEGVRINGAEKVYYLELPEKQFGYEEVLNFDFIEEYGKEYSFEFMELSEDDKSLESVSGITLTAVEGAERRSCSRALLSDTQYYIIVSKGGFSVSTAENSTIVEIEEPSDGNPFVLIAAVVTAVVVAAGAGAIIITKRKRRV